MGQYHKVDQGECLETIAAQYGFTEYHTIYNHPRNVKLREKRRNPNILYPGDILFIPDKQEKHDPRNTGQLHKFTVKVSSVLLRIYLQDRRGKPLANVAYKLKSSQQVLTGTTDEHGLVHKEIPISWNSVELELEGIGRIRTLLLGNLDPIDTISGMQARLNNLGYDAGPVDSIEGPRTRAAIIAFQQDNPGLVVDGIYGPVTRAKLLERYGC